MKILYFSAMWCPACLIMRPLLNKLQQEYPALMIEEYDYDECENLINQYQIGKILPVFILLHNNKEISRIIGEKSYKQLKASIMEAISNEKN